MRYSFNVKNVLLIIKNVNYYKSKQYACVKNNHLLIIINTGRKTSLFQFLKLIKRILYEHV